MNLCRLIKEKYPGMIIALGGAHITALPEYILGHDYIDFVCLGESENTFLKLCQSLLKRQWRPDFPELKGIPGLGFRHNSTMIINKNLELLDNIDSIPYPDWGSFPIQNYFRLKESHGNLRSERWMIMLFSRGCPYNCSFCTTPKIWKRRWRPRDPKQVVQEIKFLQRNYNIQEVHFEDENMNTDINRLKEFCDELIRQKIDIVWQTANGIRPNGLDEELLAKMIKSGCSNIVLAPESGSKRVLDGIIDKSLELGEIVRVCGIANKLKLKLAVYFIMGLPQEKKSDLFKTLRLLIMLAYKGADECLIGVFAPLPGSRLFDQLCAEGQIKVDSEFFESLIAMGDIGKAKSWSKYIANYELKIFQLAGYFLFHGTKLFLHPVKAYRTFLNIVSGRQELKTERFILLKLKKIRGCFKMKERVN